MVFVVKKVRRVTIGAEGLGQFGVFCVLEFGFKNLKFYGDFKTKAK